ncbi:copper chaperone PCu(A)C [Agromyces soli]
MTPALMLAVAAPLVLAGCAAGAAAGANGTDVAATQAASAADGLVLVDGWAKAADGGMTAVFGTLENPGDADLVVEAASTPSAETAELHETVDDGGTMKMRPKEGGFTVPAGGSFELAPGGDHVMLMGLTGALLAGDEVELSLELSDGSTVRLQVPVKDFEGADEQYDGGHEGH